MEDAARLSPGNTVHDNLAMGCARRVAEPAGAVLLSDQGPGRRGGSSAATSGR